jgi:hypothetical protein
MLRMQYRNPQTRCYICTCFDYVVCVTDANLVTR